ncbi:hypothetical protein Bca4012_027356 [Brassica carinata]
MMPKLNSNPLIKEKIKENLQRMQNLSIMNLSRPPIIKKPFHNSKSTQKSTLQLSPSRQSYRLENKGVSVKHKKYKRERLMISEGFT